MNIKPFLSDKIYQKKKLTLIDKGEIVEKYMNTAPVLSNFFWTIVSNLKITEYANCDTISVNINNPVLGHKVSALRNYSAWKIRSSKPPAVPGICHPNKSRKQHHRSLNLAPSWCKSTLENIVTKEYSQYKEVCNRQQESPSPF